MWVTFTLLAYVARKSCLRQEGFNAEDKRAVNTRNLRRNGAEKMTDLEY